jgi:hypothetical protein
MLSAFFRLTAPTRCSWDPDMLDEEKWKMLLLVVIYIHGEQRSIPENEEWLKSRLAQRVLYRKTMIT